MAQKQLQEHPRCVIQTFEVYQLIFAPKLTMQAKNVPQKSWFGNLKGLDG
jgi:hypothetical protein